MSGCDGLMPLCVGHGNSQRTCVPPGDRPSNLDAVKITICSTPPSVTSIGDEYAEQIVERRPGSFAGVAMVSHDRTSIAAARQHDDRFTDDER